MIKRLHLLIAFLIAAFALQAQNIPSGYYNGTDGLTGTALRSKLHTIVIKGENHPSYAGLWTAYETTDLKPGTNYIWDIYSDIPNGTPPYQYVYSTNQCGNGGQNVEGDCYNREHLWAQSWTNGDGTEKTDLHHVFPTDKYVNARRENYAFGEVASADWTSLNGSKLGTCKSSLGFSGTVFEPRNEFKGDIARALMYVSVRYYGDDSNWSTSDMTNKSEIKSWAITMLLRWHEEDPVSTKEINRNEAVYAIQKNRNPFIDHPEFAAAIWAPTATYQIIASANPSGAGTVSGTGTYTSGQTCTLTAAANTGYTFVSWTKNGTVVSTSASYSFTVTAAGTYQANFEENTCTIAVAANTTTGGSAFIGDSPSPSPVTSSIVFSAQGYTNASEVSSAQIDDNVSVTFNKGTNSNAPKYYSSGYAIRCYGGNYFVVSAGSYTITSITLTYGGSDGSNSITTNVDSFTSPTWTGSASSVTFTIGGSSGNRRISGISVTYSGGSPVTQANFTNGATATITASPNANYSFVNWTKNGVHVSGDATYSFTVTESATYTANFMSNTVSSNTTIASLTLNGTVTVNSDKTLTVTGNITQPEGSSIAILNGGQLICNNSVYVKMQKSITAWNASTSKGWYAIASPVNGQAFSDVTNLVNTSNSPKHNIYRYDEVEVEWEEYRDNQNIYTSFENGRGYLFRTANTGGMIEFKGDNNVDAFNYDLSYACDNNNFKGFNLLGNPFTQNITWANLVKTNVATDGYYILEESGTNQGKWSLVTLSSATIAPMRAFLVQATGSFPSVIISRTTAKAEDNNDADNIMFAVSNSQHSDEAYVKFKQGHGLNKIEHRNAEIPMLYVIDNDEHFAIADVDDNTNVINLGFEAKTMGQYTLSLKAEGDFRCLHLIDRITGEDIDMLVENEYSFIAAPTDAKNRFVVKCRCNSAANADDDIFAYQNGDDMIVEGNGILQIFDVTGRIIANHSVNGVEIIGKPTRPGLYVFRLVGEDVKTQKIVVK